MKRQIPNICTCCNLVTGCISIVCAFRGWLDVASLLILLSAVFDFFDGFLARLLKVQSPIGVDLDSLADVVSFGVAPTMILFLFTEGLVGNMPPALRNSFAQFLPYFAFIIPAFSAMRLAKFNHDETQKKEFHGLATPANALFIGYLHFAAKELTFLNNLWIILALTLIFALLLVSNLPMFSLKFQHLRFKENELRYIFLVISLILLIIFKLGAFPIIILSYILISTAAFAIKKHI